MDLSCASARSSSSAGQLPLWLVLSFSLLSCAECQVVLLLTGLPFCTGTSLFSSGKVSACKAELVLTGVCWTLTDAYSSKTVNGTGKVARSARSVTRFAPPGPRGHRDNYSLNYLVLPSARRGWVFTSQAEVVVDIEFILWQFSKVS